MIEYHCQSSIQLNQYLGIIAMDDRERFGATYLFGFFSINPGDLCSYQWSDKSCHHTYNISKVNLSTRISHVNTSSLILVTFYKYIALVLWGYTYVLEFANRAPYQISTQYCFKLRQPSIYCL